MKIETKKFRMEKTAKIDLGKWPTDVDPLYKSKKKYKKALKKRTSKLKDLQRLHYASNCHAILLIFQAMDAGGKDGAIRHVMSGINHPEIFPPLQRRYSAHGAGSFLGHRQRVVGRGIMKTKIKLTDARVRQLAAEAVEYVVWDSQLFGFGVRVRPTGFKAFVLHGRVHGKVRKITLGRFPVISEPEARRACIDMLTDLQTGEEPKRKAGAPRFDAFVSGTWYEQKFLRLKPSGQRSTQSYINARLLPQFGTLYLDEIDRAMVSRWFDQYSKTFPGGANRSLEILLSILEFAVVCGHIKDNPAKGLRKNPKKLRNRFLSAEEIAAVSDVLDKAEGESTDYRQAADIVRLLLLTGCRHREITLLEWAMVKGDKIKLPDTKTGPREVYLSEQACAILKRQPRTVARWVFPSIKAPKQPRDNIDGFWRDIPCRLPIEV